MIFATNHIFPSYNTMFLFCIQAADEFYEGFLQLFTFFLPIIT